MTQVKRFNDWRAAVKVARELSVELGRPFRVRSELVELYGWRWWIVEPKPRTIEPCPTCRADVRTVVGVDSSYRAEPCGHPVAVTRWPDRIELDQLITESGLRAATIAELHSFAAQSAAKAAARREARLDAIEGTQ